MRIIQLNKIKLYCKSEDFLSFRCELMNHDKANDESDVPRIFTLDLDF